LFFDHRAEMLAAGRRVLLRLLTSFTAAKKTSDGLTPDEAYMPNDSSLCSVRVCLVRHPCLLIKASANLAVDSRDRLVRIT